MSFIFRGIKSGITELFSDDKEMHAPVSSRPQPRVGKLLSAKELLALEEKLDDDLSRCRATLNCRPGADTRSAAVALVHSAAVPPWCSSNKFNGTGPAHLLSSPTRSCCYRVCTPASVHSGQVLLCPLLHCCCEWSENVSAV